MKSHKKGFLDLPPEIRLQIYDCIAPRQDSATESRAIFYFGKNVLKNSDWEPNDGPLLCTNRLIYGEAAKLLLRNTKVLVKIQYNEHVYEFVDAYSNCGVLEGMSLWPFVTILELDISLMESIDCQLINLNRISRLAKAIEYGKHLQKLRIVIVVACRCTLLWMVSDVVESLEVLRVSGEVKVQLDITYVPSETEREHFREAEALCLQLEDTIKGRSHCLSSIGP